MAHFDRDTTSANAPGYDGSAEVLQQRQAAMHALVNGGGTVTALAAAGAGGTLDSTGATISNAEFGQLHQPW